MNRATRVRFQTAHVTFAVIDHEILSSVIRTVPLLWLVQKFQFLAEVKATSAGKLLDSLPRDDAVVELCSGEFNVAYCPDRSENYQYHHHIAL
jgi:hypothetical protein